MNKKTIGDLALKIKGSFGFHVVDSLFDAGTRGRKDYFSAPLRQILPDLSTT